VVLDTLCKGDKIIMGLIDDVSMVQPYWQKQKFRCTWSCAKLEDFGIAVKKVNNNGLFTPKKMKNVNNNGLFTKKNVINLIFSRLSTLLTDDEKIKIEEKNVSDVFEDGKR
jgi:hypothetical protein